VAVLLALAMLVFAFGLVARRLERTIIKEATIGAVEKMGIISETDIFIALRREATII
jgi:hypothetical protein